nr:Chain P, Envelope glycoprotein gp160 [Human immunodeficiency virus type 1 (BRU ISOLATE)]
RGPGCAFVTI